MTDRSALHAVLDAGLICHVAFVVDEAPVVIPTGYGREGDTLYVHGSTGARSLRVAAEGVEVCVNVTLLDGVVYGRSVFHNSVNYRSAVVHGRARAITDVKAKLHGLRVLTDHIAPGSWDYARPPNPRELAATALLALDLTESAVKIRQGGPAEEDEDVEADKVWAGHIPIRREWGAPQPCRLMSAGHGVPDHVSTRADGPL